MLQCYLEKQKNYVTNDRSCVTAVQISESVV